ncbi:MAG: acetylxylan esterase [Gemmataceae bacterium]|nr:acetylxylan esterase [Gemmataceae bacterium]
MADESAFDKYIRGEAVKLREKDLPPKTRDEWLARRKTLLKQMSAAIGPVPEAACDLEPRILGTLEREGYRIEKLVFQSRPDVWVTSTAYVPTFKDSKKVPAVLVVHGHWAGARRDPVVQARCLGLVKLGFFVLSVDAFGAGERFTKPARGTYHGALYGSTLWPTGHSLLGMQVYDNRRAIDYLLTRKEVNGKFGITGASGGGNQSMNAGALDERFDAVVPVCSVGNYQSYLRAACCVCEVLPNALKFTEEGDVLGLVAPRALLVMNAARDGIQFSPPEAEKSLARAKEIYKAIGEEAKVKHVVFDSGHDYNKAMRETMYGWMTLHLKGEGKGEPIAEPAYKLDTIEDLACYPNPDDRPKSFLTPPLFAGKVGRELVEKANKLVPDHPEMWEATSTGMRRMLRDLLGKPPLATEVKLAFAPPEAENPTRLEFTLTSEPGIEIKGMLNKPEVKEKLPDAIVVSFNSADEALPANRNLPPLGTHFRLAPRGTGKAAPKSGAIAGAPDHTPAEHGIWIGKTLLAQWTTDTTALMRGANGIVTPFVMVGIGPAATVALTASILLQDHVRALVLVDPMVSWVTDTPYASGTPMGLLVPGILKIGDMQHLVALNAPRRIIIAGGTSPQGKKLSQKELEEAFKFTTDVYKAMKVPNGITIAAEADWGKIEL